MPDWSDTQLVRYYQQDRLRDAAQYRLMQEAQSATPAKPRYAPTLAYIGGWLILWGNRLQSHYGALADNLSSAVSVDCDTPDKATAG